MVNYLINGIIYISLLISIVSSEEGCADQTWPATFRLVEKNTCVSHSFKFYILFFKIFNQ